MIVEAELRKSQKYIEELDLQMNELVERTKRIHGVTVDNKNGKYAISGIGGGEFEYNAKSRNSIKMKMIYKREYTSIDKFKDLLRMRFILADTASEEEYIETVLRVASMYEKNSLPTLKVKGQILTKGSIEKLENAGIQVSIEQNGTSSNVQYRDMKFIGGKIDL